MATTSVSEIPLNSYPRDSNLDFKVSLLYKFPLNITLGLKYLRVSPDHGTAKNLIGKNRIKITKLAPKSLLGQIK